MIDSENQKKAFKKFSRLKCGALFMSMGTGKTKVALDLASYKLEQKKVDYILYIAPASLINKGEIQDECDKWHKGLEVHYQSCEGIGASDRMYCNLLNEITGHKVFCIVDESLKIKNVTAKRTGRIIEIGSRCDYRLVMNGTPLSKNVMDLWSQMEFLSPKILKMTCRQFKDTFCVYDLKGKYKGRVKKQENIPYLISLISPYIYQAELDIEATKKYHTEYYYVDSKEYECMKDDLFLKYYNDERKDINFNAFSMAIQKWYTAQGQHQDAINKAIENINDQVIVFVKYLGNIPTGAKAITGSVKERKQIIDDFKNKKFNVLYITYGCGSFGLNLQFCKNIIFADHTWDYAQRIQAEGRIYRMDITDDVNYWDIVCDNSGLEAMIFNCIHKKTDRLHEVKKEITNAKGNKAKIKELCKKL